MAVDILTIPSISTILERLFSETKLILIDLHNRLSIELLEAFVIGTRPGIGVRSGNRGSLRKLHNDGY
jgi:hypothetical protein